MITDGYTAKDIDTWASVMARSIRAVAQKLEHAIKAYVGLSANAQLAMPMAIERSLGKAKRIVDRRSDK